MARLLAHARCEENLKMRGPERWDACTRGLDAAQTAKVRRALEALEAYQPFEPILAALGDALYESTSCVILPNGVTRVHFGVDPTTKWFALCAEVFNTSYGLCIDDIRWTSVADKDAHEAKRVLSGLFAVPVDTLFAFFYVHCMLLDMPVTEIPYELNYRVLNEAVLAIRDAATCTKTPLQ